MWLGEYVSYLVSWPWDSVSTAFWSPFYKKSQYLLSETYNISGYTHAYIQPHPRHILSEKLLNAASQTDQSLNQSSVTSRKCQIEYSNGLIFYIQEIRTSFYANAFMINMLTKLTRHMHCKRWQRLSDYVTLDINKCKNRDVLFGPHRRHNILPWTTPFQSRRDSQCSGQKFMTQTTANLQ